MFFRVDPEFFVFPYLKNQGLIPYLQIIDQHFPGGFFLPINFTSLGFTTPESFQKLWLLIIVLISLLIFKLTKKFSSVLLFITLWPFFDGFHVWIDTFVSLFSLAVYYFYTKQKYWLSGIFIALAVLFKQTTLLFIPLLITYEIIYKKTKLIHINLSKLIFPVIILLLYFYFTLPQNFWYLTIIFNFTSYVGHAFYFSQIPKILIIFLPTLLLIKKYPLIYGFIAINLIGFISRPDLVHLQPIAPFLILLLFNFIDNYLKKLLIPILISLLILNIYKLNKPNNFSYFDDSTTMLINYLTSHTQKNQQIFLLGVQPHVYTFSHTLPVGHLFVYQLPWYMSKYEDQQLKILQKNPPKLIVFDSSASVDNQPITTYAEKLIDFVQNHYQLTNHIGNYQIFKKIN